VRPLRLELEGFAAFRDRTEVDFTDLDLVALVGPTGSGKSTIIDALTFALYGSVARYDNTKLVAPVIHQLATEARVRFDFELAGAHYVAVRVVRRAKSKATESLRATTREARLERIDGDGASTVLAGNVKELDQGVEELIGLNFTQFTRTIVLPQGEFAEFLKDDPRDRQVLLRKLLDLDIYARMGVRAREQATEAGRWIELRNEELGRLAQATPQRLAERRQALDALTSFARSLPDRLARLDELEDGLRSRREAVLALDGSLRALAAVVVPDGLSSADEVTTAARAALDAARAERDAAQEARTRAVEAVDAGPDPSSVRALLDRHQRRAELETALAVIRAELAATRSELDDHQRSLTTATEELATAEAAHAEAHASAQAAPWVAQLRVGAPCPICEQDVATLPPSHATVPPEPLALVSEAADRVETARAMYQRATTAVAHLQGKVTSKEAEEAQRAKAVDDLVEALVEHPEPGLLTAQLASATEAAAEADRSATALRRAEQAASETEAALTRVSRAEQEHRVVFVAQRDAVVALGPPPPGDDSLLTDWRALAAWAATRADELGAQRAELGEEGKALAATKAELLAALARNARCLDLDPAPEALTATVAGAAATLEVEIEHLQVDLARCDELEAELARLTEHNTVFDALGQHLSAAGFERWLLAEALDDLVHRATDRLMELSSGRYSLEAVDGSFAVRDHGNADERRDIRTLSGGEIFLASLSLALALAESIADLASVDGPRLESIFLDEGFGTLDPDTLDVLASAIEELSASGRLVCVVTHVRDLAERMPVRFEIRKGPTTATIERVEG
jgi:exonuclease SbcC